MSRKEELREIFAGGESWFHDSPLYAELTRAVAGDDALLELAACVPPGPQPMNMLMGATHLLLLRDPELAFARFFPTIAGAHAASPAEAAGEYGAFCREHRAALAEILATRLVQTNEPARATALRLGLREVGRRVPGSVTFLEVGSSAGLQLRFDRWAIRVGDRRFGPDPAPLTITTEWRGAGPPPDLGALPMIAERLGIDLHPVDARDPEERRWLQALIWPEHVERFAALGRALDALAADPPEILAGDAIELLPRLDADRLTTARPLVVFHSQVRMHVPADRRGAFDEAIERLGARRRLLRIMLEHRDAGAAVLSLHDSAGEPVDLARAHGHGRWIAPNPDPGRPLAPASAPRA